MRYKSKKQYRLKGYDYSSGGCYFVTICMQNRKHFFGQVVEEEIRLSKLGKIAKDYWLEIPKHFLCVELDQYVVMPNHVHGIVVIHSNRRNAPWHVPTGIQPLVKNSLSSIINHYKGAVKRFCNKNDLEYFSWQLRYYDHIVRNDEDLNRIREYIIHNPLKWAFDRNNLENLYI